GFESFESIKRMTTQSSFRLNTLALQFTAMGIMILKESRKLSYSDKVKKHIPEFPYNDITILNLLQQTSGMPDYMDLIPEEIPDETVLFNKDVLNLLVSHTPDLLFEPGEYWAFCATGYVILAVIIERASGRTYTEFMTSKIFEPLEMNHTYVANGDPKQGIPNRVYGYDKDKMPTDWDITNGIVGDGGIYSSVEDLFRWDKALYTEDIVSKSTIKEAYTPYELNGFGDSTEDYGFGVDLRNRHGNHHIDAEGNRLGFYNYFSRNLKNKSSIIILTNQNSKPNYIATYIEDIISELRN
ncbi:MAG: beta-lactamase family protein, partial [Flavobacteriales bacterium]|nr:beta-lactamase family protein [Flavobacteriales bacterium]